MVLATVCLASGVVSSQGRRGRAARCLRRSRAFEMTAGPQGDGDVLHIGASEVTETWRGVLRPWRR
jgi:hypothetical protein